MYSATAFGLVLNKTLCHSQFPAHEETQPVVVKTQFRVPLFMEFFNVQSNKCFFNSSIIIYIDMSVALLNFLIFKKGTIIVAT